MANVVPVQDTKESSEDFKLITQRLNSDKLRFDRNGANLKFQFIDLLETVKSKWKDIIMKYKSLQALLRDTNDYNDYITREMNEAYEQFKEDTAFQLNITVADLTNRHEHIWCWYHYPVSHQPIDAADRATWPGLYYENKFAPVRRELCARLRIILANADQLFPKHYIYDQEFVLLCKDNIPTQRIWDYQVSLYTGLLLKFLDLESVNQPHLECFKQAEQIASDIAHPNAVHAIIRIVSESHDTPVNTDLQELKEQFNNCRYNENYPIHVFAASMINFRTIALQLAEESIVDQYFNITVITDKVFEATMKFYRASSNKDQYCDELRAWCEERNTYLSPMERHNVQAKYLDIVTDVRKFHEWSARVYTNYKNVIHARKLEAPMAWVARHSRGAESRTKITNTNLMLEQAHLCLTTVQGITPRKPKFNGRAERNERDRSSGFSTNETSYYRDARSPNSYNTSAKSKLQQNPLLHRINTALTNVKAKLASIKSTDASDTASLTEIKRALEYIHTNIIATEGTLVDPDVQFAYINVLTESEHKLQSFEDTTSDDSSETNIITPTKGISKEELVNHLKSLSTSDRAEVFHTTYNEQKDTSHTADDTTNTSEYNTDHKILDSDDDKNTELNNLILTASTGNKEVNNMLYTASTLTTEQSAQIIYNCRASYKDEIKKYIQHSFHDSCASAGVHSDNHFAVKCATIKLDPNRSPDILTVSEANKPASCFIARYIIVPKNTSQKAYVCLEPVLCADNFTQHKAYIASATTWADTGISTTINSTEANSFIHSINAKHQIPVYRLHNILALPAINIDGARNLNLNLYDIHTGKRYDETAAMARVVESLKFLIEQFPEKLWYQDLIHHIIHNSPYSRVLPKSCKRYN